MNATEKPTEDQLDQLDESMEECSVLLRGPQAEAIRGVVKDVWTKKDHHQALCDDRAAAVTDHSAWNAQKWHTTKNRGGITSQSDRTNLPSPRDLHHRNRILPPTTTSKGIKRL